MAMIEQKVYDSLKNNTDITDLVGTRIYPSAIPEEADYPCMSFTTIGNRDITTLKNDMPTLNFKRLQVSIWAENYGTCKLIEGYIKDSIYGIGGRTQDIRDSVDRDSKIFGTSVDIIINNK